jgi:nucleotide-binding universal stress UspA family protein
MKMMKTKNYIVTYDFTSVSENALKHAIHLARAGNAQIYVLHLVSSEAKIASKKQALIQALEEFGFLKDSVDIIPEVRVGSIFDGIQTFAKEKGSSKIIMGTHGAVGMQKLFGSNAIKVVKSSDLPFYIVQEGQQWEDIQTIIVPIDTSKESIQIISHAADIAFLFNSKILVVGELQKDVTASRQMKTRIKIVEDKFQSLGVDATVKLFEYSGSYVKKVLDLAREHNAQLIASAYVSGSLIPVLDTFHQSLIMNEAKIPVLIIQSQEVSFSYY